MFGIVLALGWIALGVVCWIFWRAKKREDKRGWRPRTDGRTHPLPDQARRRRAQARRRDPRAHGGSWPHDPRGEAPDGRPRARRDALRGALARSRSSASSSTSSRRRRRWRSCSRATRRSRSSARPWAARIPSTQRPARSAATSLSRCRTTSSTDRIRRSRRRGRSRSGSPTLTDGSVERNAAAWDGYAADYLAAGRRNWESNEPDWGIWSIPESEVGFLSEVDGLDVVELGCGTGYVSSWIARRGGRPVGVDPSTAQLENARRFQEEFGISFPLVQAGAEYVPLAGCVVRPRAVRVRGEPLGRSGALDPRGGAAPAAGRPARVPADLAAARPVLAPRREHPRAGGAPGAAVRRARPDRVARRGRRRVRAVARRDDPACSSSSGFVVEELRELQAPEGGDSGQWDFVTLEWARQWPCEEVWKARKPA